jgi:hypothetical protein
VSERGSNPFHKTTGCRLGPGPPLPTLIEWSSDLYWVYWRLLTPAPCSLSVPGYLFIASMSCYCYLGFNTPSGNQDGSTACGRKTTSYFKKRNWRFMRAIKSFWTNNLPFVLTFCRRSVKSRTRENRAVLCVCLSVCLHVCGEGRAGGKRETPGSWFGHHTSGSERSGKQHKGTLIL